MSKPKNTNKFDLKDIAKDLDYKTMKVDNQKSQMARNNVMTSNRMRRHRNSFKNQHVKGV